MFQFCIFRSGDVDASDTDGGDAGGGGASYGYANGGNADDDGSDGDVADGGDVPTDDLHDQVDGLVLTCSVSWLVQGGLKCSKAILLRTAVYCEVTECIR